MREWWALQSWHHYLLGTGIRITAVNEQIPDFSKKSGIYFLIVVFIEVETCLVSQQDFENMVKKPVQVLVSWIQDEFC